MYRKTVNMRFKIHVVGLSANKCRIPETIRNSANRSKKKN